MYSGSAKKCLEKKMRAASWKGYQVAETRSPSLVVKSTRAQVSRRDEKVKSRTTCKWARLLLVSVTQAVWLVTKNAPQEQEYHLAWGKQTNSSKGRSSSFIGCDSMHKIPELWAVVLC